MIRALLHYATLLVLSGTMLPAQSLFINTIVPAAAAVAMEYDSASRTTYVAGSFIGTIDAGSGTGLIRTSAGATDAFVLALDAAWHPLWLTTFGGPGNDEVVDIDLHPTHGLAIALVAGSGMAETTTYRIGTTVFSGRGNADAVTLLLGTDGTVTWARVDGDVNPDVPSGIAFVDDSTIATSGLFVERARFGTDILRSAADFSGYVQGIGTDGRHRWVTSVLPRNIQGRRGTATAAAIATQRDELKVFVSATCPVEIGPTAIDIDCERQAPAMVMATMQTDGSVRETTPTTWCDASWASPYFRNGDLRAYAYSQPGQCYAITAYTIADIAAPDATASTMAFLEYLEPLRRHAVSGTFLAGGFSGYIDLQTDMSTPIFARSSDMLDGFVIQRNIRNGTDSATLLRWPQASTHTIAAIQAGPGGILCASRVSGGANGLWLTSVSVTTSVPQSQAQRVPPAAMAWAELRLLRPTAVYDVTGREVNTEEPLSTPCPVLAVFGSSTRYVLLMP